MRYFRRALYNPYILIAIVLVIGIVFFVLYRQDNSEPKIEYARVQLSNVIEKVSVTGKILPARKADLAFEKSGVVKTMPFKIGDTLKKSDLVAQLNSESDQAALDSAKAHLNELLRGLRPEEYASNEAVVFSASTSLANARRNTLIAARDGFVKAQGAVLNNTDIFFNNAQSANPTIKVVAPSYPLQIAINEKRSNVNDALMHWKAEVDHIGAGTNPLTLMESVDKDLATIKDFMSSLSDIVGYLTPNNSGLSQTAIDTYLAAMNSGLASFTQAISALDSARANLQNAISAYDQATNKFLVEIAGASNESIAAERAKVAQYQAELNKNKIISPIDGVLTRSEPELGEFVSAGKVLFTIQSADEYKIEANVAEADIAKLGIGNNAAITLDAYGPSVVFDATVRAVDPAETILEGVPTYKVTLAFEQDDNRIRSGMTANIDIITRQKQGVLTVPTRAVTGNNGTKTVKILRADGKTFDTVHVTTGLKGSDGTFEIISGLNEGDRVITYMK